MPKHSKKARDFREKQIAKLREEHKETIEKESFRAELDQIDEDTKEAEDGESDIPSVHVFKPAINKSIVFETTKDIPPPSKVFEEEKKLQEDKIKKSLKGKKPNRMY